jgi:cyclohexa-1,5-dienecarbonyl-CoA hydratase
MAEQYTRLQLDFMPPVARITLNNPPLNVIDMQMMEDLLSALAKVEEQADISALVIGGSMRAFSGGVDITVHTPDQVEAMLSRFHRVIHAVITSKKVTIASVKRHCLGGGAELAMVCDLVYCSNDAVFGFPEIKLGCYPPVAATVLAALIGQKRAADLILTARSVEAKEALWMGLVNGTAADPETLVDDALARLRGLSPAALAVTKKALYAWDSVHFDKGLARAEQIYHDDLMKTEDAQEGIRAYIEKRRPVWKGK